ncbi:MAG TPA: DNA starvation/stationary phase protection protein Dps [Acetobacteraceae bacterium]|nr:DNA starvation/stationary phase protection protein Dps [Acetobacteraceae bacterium]
MATHEATSLVHGHLHRNRNTLNANTKTSIVALLNARLADGIDLALMTKQAHWNVKGPQFIGIHEMLDGFRTKQDDWNDMMAERAAQLGGAAIGTSQAIMTNSKLAPYPTDIYTIADHLAALIDRYATFAAAIHASIAEADAAGDATTTDLFTEISRGADKQLWFLEAHVQEPTGRMRDGDNQGSRA